MDDKKYTFENVAELLGKVQDELGYDGEHIISVTSHDGVTLHDISIFDLKPEVFNADMRTDVVTMGNEERGTGYYYYRYSLSYSDVEVSLFSKNIPLVSNE